MARMVMFLVTTVKKSSGSKRSMDKSQTVAAPVIHVKEKTQFGTSLTVRK